MPMTPQLSYHWQEQTQELRAPAMNPEMDESRSSITSGNGMMFGLHLRLASILTAWNRIARHTKRLCGGYSLMVGRLGVI